MLKIRSTNDHMISCLRDRDDKLCLDAADELLRQRAHIQMLERRIHKQRVMLRENWQVIEMRTSHRRAWYPSKLLTHILKLRAHGQSGSTTK